MADELFGFDFDPRTRPLLALVGVTPRTAGVRLSPQRLLVRFGLAKLETPLHNVIDARVTGPYTLWRAVGPRLSGRDSGITFGTSAGPGVCILFDEPVRVAYPHAACTLTLKDPESFVARWHALAHTAH